MEVGAGKNGLRKQSSAIPGAAPSLGKRILAVIVGATGLVAFATTVLWLPFLLLLLWPVILLTAVNGLTAALVSAIIVYRLDPSLLRRVMPESMFLLVLRFAESWTALTREVRRIRTSRKHKPQPTVSTRAPHPDTSAFLPNADSVHALRILEKHGDHDRLIPSLRRLLRRDPALYSNPWVISYIGRRWRYLFLVEAARDSTAVAVSRASNRPWRSRALGAPDSRSDTQCLAERFLLGPGRLDHVLVEGDPSTVPMPAFRPPDPSSLNVGLLFVPGLLNGLLPVRAFETALAECAERFGVRVLRADCHPLRGCAANVQDILAAVNDGAGLNADTTQARGEPGQRPFDKFVAIGYSKGVPDTLTAYVADEGFRQRCRGVISWAGAIGGSFVADETYATLPVRDIDSILLSMYPLLNPLTRRGRPNTKVTDAVRDLCTWTRDDFNMQHHEILDAMKVPVLCFTAACQASEVPFFQIQSSLKLRGFDANNDMQLTEPQTLLDVTTGLQVARVHATHWDVSYPKFPSGLDLGSRKLDHPFPKTAAMAAHFMLAMELGLLLDDSADES